MSKSMIGLDPLAWLSPGSSGSASAKKKSKKKAKKKIIAKKAAPKKSVAQEKVAKKKVAKKKIAKKKVAKKKAVAKSVVVKKKVVAKSTAVKKSSPKKASSKKTVVKKVAITNKPKYVSPLGLDVETLEFSFNLLAPQAEQLVANFYKELFEQHPAVVPMFKNTTPEEQQKKLLAALKLVINNIRKPDVLAEALKGLGSKHQGYGAVPAHYQAVASTLIGVMHEMAGDAWTDQIQAAWEHALTTIADVMLTGYEQTETETEAEIEKGLSDKTENEGNPVSDSIIKLNDVQDISQVGELHKRLSGLLNETDIVFDGADVERIDTASLQLLTSVFMHAETYGSSVSWQSSSDALKKSAYLLGLTQVLKL